MSDVVISGRIPQSLMDQLKQLGKSNSEIVNEALKMYIEKINTQSNVYTPVYNNKDSSEYNLLCRCLDSLPQRYTKK